MDKNREFHELVGLCWHEPESEQSNRFGYCRNCGKHMPECESNPDYAADPRLILKEMVKRPDWDEFQKQVIDPFAYMLDDTGLLRDAAIKFIRKEDKR